MLSIERLGDGYCIAFQGMVVGGPYGSHEDAERSMPFCRALVDIATAIQVCGHVTEDDVQKIMRLHMEVASVAH